MDRSNRLVLLLSLCAAFPACQYMGKSEPKAASLAEGTTAVSGDGKLRQAESALKVSKRRLDQARMQLESEIAAREREVGFATKELELSRGKLASFEAIEAPNKLAQADLDLQRVRDNAQERAEELEQIKVMYDEQQIDDKTKEFVLERGKRSAAQSARQLEIAARGLELATKHDLPRERARLELDVARKESDLAKATAALNAERLDREIRVLSAEAEVAKAEGEFAQASESKP